ncbi:hypothetical protein StoSoilB3_18130 [Arthrobacter sp. StoSoilB3]|nr:hypothetical protein StoSoilB3_18130 [Arthrobacter sp. StoSoilB3]
MNTLPHSQGGEFCCVNSGASAYAYHDVGMCILSNLHKLSQSLDWVMGLDPAVNRYGSGSQRTDEIIELLGGADGLACYEKGTFKSSPLQFSGNLLDSTTALDDSFDTRHVEDTWLTHSFLQ